MDTETAFLEDIEQHPLDDVPRLIYADWLQDQDDPVRAARGEFIRAQVEAARLHVSGEHPEEWLQLTNRARHMQEQFQWIWLGKNCSRKVRWVFQRGFLVALGDEGIWEEVQTPYRYLARFYDDGVVVSDSSTEPIGELWSRFHRHDRQLGQGRYNLQWAPRGVHLTFHSNTTTGRVDYSGEIVGMRMNLTWFSHINQNSGRETYHLQLPF